MKTKVVFAPEDTGLRKKAIREIARKIRKAAVGLTKNDAAKLSFVYRCGYDEITVEDDGGYRSILIGDAVSQKGGYVLIYVDKEYDDAGNEKKFDFPCFPLAKDIEKALTKLLDGEDMSDVKCFGGACFDGGCKKSRGALARFVLHEMAAIEANS